MFVVPVQPALLQNLTLTLNVQHLLVDAHGVARKHKSRNLEVKHLLVALVNNSHGFAGAIIKDLLREKGRSLNLWVELLKLDPIKDAKSLIPGDLRISEQLEWVLTEAAYITKVHERGGIGSPEILLAIAKLIKEPEQKDFPTEVTNSIHFQDKVNHVVKKFIFHSNAVHMSEFDIIKKLLDIEPNALEEKVSMNLKTFYERSRLFR